MTIDNLLANVPSPLMFTVGACFRAHLSALGTLQHIGQIVVLQLLYGYVFDASNQARDAEEDRVNKPHRPVPAGLITSSGSLRRFWAVMPLYSLLGWKLGVLEWVVLFQLTTIFLNLLCPPRLYLWCKTPCMIISTVAQLAAAWQVVSPIDTTALLWILLIPFVFSLALPFEDVRDMAGDRAIGRRTPALILGHWPVRIWFAALLAGIPVLLHYALFLPTGASPGRTAVCDALVATACWLPAVRALTLRHTAADRITYQMLILAYVTTMMTSLILWA
ncbi:UbiA family prenyltransferase [Kitasatospora indigofera]|uniref:UbiA family prenyltransferase n=1 Tax=Kitasatospora indigofera TaxID=67307 RepID=UPI0036B0B55C